MKTVYGADWKKHWDNRNEISETALDDVDVGWDFVLDNPTYKDLELFIPELYRLVYSP